MYKLTLDINKDIADYCRLIMSTLNNEYLDSNNVNKNEFLEVLYVHCQTLYEQTGNYEMLNENISYLFSAKKVNEEHMNLIKKGELIVKGIDKNDNLIITTE